MGAKLRLAICVKKQTEPLSDRQKAEFLAAAGSQRFEAYRHLLADVSRGKVDKEMMGLASGSDGFGHVDFPFD